MIKLLASRGTTVPPTPDAWRPRKAETRLWPWLLRALGRETRWSSLSVASYMIGQLGILIVVGGWPLRRPIANTMRGVDFYPWKDFIRAVIHGAHEFKAENGYLPSLASPASFNEHLFARKFFAPLPMPSLADKLAAKDYVKARLGDEFLPAVAWVGDDIVELFSAKPPAGRYFLKSNRGWNSNLLVTLPEDLSAKRDDIQQWAKNGLASRFGYDWGEWQYWTFEPKFFLEEFIDFNGVETPDDYKFLCFRGKVRLIEIDVDRFTELRSAFYAPDWKYIPVNYGEAPIQRPRPGNLEDMIRVAEAIAGEMEFARVDLYSDGNSRIRFGEITFVPGNAGLHFSDFKLDQWLGTLFTKQVGNITPWNL